MWILIVLVHSNASNSNWIDWLIQMSWFLCLKYSIFSPKFGMHAHNDMYSIRWHWHCAVSLCSCHINSISSQRKLFQMHLHALSHTLVLTTFFFNRQCVFLLFSLFTYRTGFSSFCCNLRFYKRSVFRCYMCNIASQMQ